MQHWAGMDCFMKALIYFRNVSVKTRKCYPKVSNYVLTHSFPGFYKVFLLEEELG